MAVESTTNLATKDSSFVNSMRSGNLRTQPDSCSNCCLRDQDQIQKLRANCGIEFRDIKNKKLCPLFSLVSGREPQEHSLWWQLQQDTKSGELWKDTWKAAVLRSPSCIPCDSFAFNLIPFNFPSKPSHPCRDNSYHPLSSYTVPLFP